MSDEPTLLSDTSLCERLSISKSTLYRLIASGPPKTAHPDAQDIRTIRHVYVGGARRWHADSVTAFLNNETPQQKEA